MTRRLGFTMLNILGMALGLASCLVLINYLVGQWSFDKFHQDSGRIYRIVSDTKIGVNEDQYPAVPPRIGYDLVNTMPEVEASTRFYKPSDPLVRVGTKAFTEERLYAADSMLFDVFDFVLLEGNEATVLHEPNTVLITPEIGRKYFSEETNIVGRTMLLGEERVPFVIEGIIESPPENSQIQFDMLTSMASWEEPNYFMWSYIWANTVTYVKLFSGSDPARVNEKIPGMVADNISETTRRVFQASYEELVARGDRFNFFIQPLEDVFLHSGGLGNLIGPVGNIQYFRVFFAVACFMLFIACINFMNLSTAQAGQRAKEIGIRKTLGSVKSRIARQFAVEAYLYSLFALLIGLGLYELLVQVLVRWVQVDLVMGFDLLHRFCAMLVLAFVMGTLAGLYPAYYMTSFKPIEALKGKVTRGLGAARLRSGLVVFQFAISIALIICTLVVYQQWQYARYADLGFDSNQVLVVENAFWLENNLAPFMDEVRNTPGVVSASSSTHIPGQPSFVDFWEVVGKEGNTTLGAIQADPSLLTTLGLEMAEGRFFDEIHSSDSSGIVLNQAAVAAFGLAEPLGAKLTYSGGWNHMPEYYTVIGVVEDFHNVGFQEEISSLGILLEGPNNLPFPPNYLAIKYRAEETKEVIGSLRAKWSGLSMEAPFQFSFLDESFGRHFQSEYQLGKVLGVFSGLTIFIACLGLFGLAAYTAERRTKEVGVRKVLGASESQLIRMLNRHFTQLVLLAFLIGAPIAGYGMNLWLQTFVYHIDLGMGIFVVGGLSALLIAIATVSVHSWRVSRLNPVKSLKDE